MGAAIVGCAFQWIRKMIGFVYIIFALQFLIVPMIDILKVGKY